ncbi:hypothetical protein KFL_000380380 [Klebsormidium nitens]|uniref:Uncharacterized protein n=1 Tax=Klebsormidium nitens TaxID=105231 RepID=A0A1Y1HTE2_KLENI|nr:hypothetical protein KFL_000380380 [Klebsormidium nitens]|eukprot:GAQ79807.1 hypothetical protein KFL_000380380 [Klebsormidium nitens]
MYVYVGAGSITTFKPERTTPGLPFQSLVLGGDASGIMIDEDVKIGSESVRITRNVEELEQSSFPLQWTVSIPLPEDVDTSIRGNKRVKNGVQAVYLKKRKLEEKIIVEDWLEELNSESE